MALLVGLGALATKGISMVPTKAQNISELVVSSMEEFMVTITGDEGRWLFPLAGTVFLYVFIGNLIGLVPGFFPPTANLNTTASCALVVAIRTRSRSMLKKKRTAGSQRGHITAEASQLPEKETVQDNRI